GGHLADTRDGAQNLAELPGEEVEFVLSDREAGKPREVRNVVSTHGVFRCIRHDSILYPPGTSLIPAHSQEVTDAAMRNAEDTPIGQAGGCVLPTARRAA